MARWASLVCGNIEPDRRSKQRVGRYSRGQPAAATPTRFAHPPEWYTSSVDDLIEYRAVLRAAVAELYARIEAAIGKTQDVDTVLHLRLIRAQLLNVS
jgi:hypothetical protein